MSSSMGVVGSTVGSTGFVADAIITHLRTGHQPTEEEAMSLIRFGVIDALRDRVTDSDLPQILSIVENESGWLGAFYLCLLKRFCQDDAVQQKLRQRWENASPFFRAQLLWRMLDDPNLPGDWHARIFNFVRENWEEFGRLAIVFHGSADAVVPQVLRRLGDPGFPESKKWIYLCVTSVGADDRAAAKALVNLGRSMPDPFTRHVAEILWEQFSSETDRSERAATCR